jgi:hypothetical protein
MISLDTAPVPICFFYKLLDSETVASLMQFFTQGNGIFDCEIELTSDQNNKPSRIIVRDNNNDGEVILLTHRIRGNSWSAQFSDHYFNEQQMPV